jgi:hypothetical protein
LGPKRAKGGETGKERQRREERYLGRVTAKKRRSNPAPKGAKRKKGRTNP